MIYINEVKLSSWENDESHVLYTAFVLKSYPLASVLSLLLPRHTPTFFSCPYNIHWILNIFIILIFLTVNLGSG